MSTFYVSPRFICIKKKKKEIYQSDETDIKSKKLNHFNRFRRLNFFLFLRIIMAATYYEQNTMNK